MAKKGDVVLLTDDDADDRLLVRDAFETLRPKPHLICLSGGEELLGYLKSRNWSESVRPCLILLDLNMPGMGGLEALRIIKSDPDLKRIPVVMLTTSGEQQDLLECYGLGANSYIVKPATFEGLVAAVKSLDEYWFRIVELPRPTPPPPRIFTEARSWHPEPLIKPELKRYTAFIQ